MSPSGIHLTRKLFTLNLSVLNFKTNYGKRICLCVPTDRDTTNLHPSPNLGPTPRGELGSQERTSEKTLSSRKHLHPIPGPMTWQSLDQMPHACNIAGYKYPHYCTSGVSNLHSNYGLPI